MDVDRVRLVLLLIFSPSDTGVVKLDRMLKLSSKWDDDANGEGEKLSTVEPLTVGCDTSLSVLCSNCLRLFFEDDSDEEE